MFRNSKFYNNPGYGIVSNNDTQWYRTRKNIELLCSLTAILKPFLSDVTGDIVHVQSAMYLDLCGSLFVLSSQYILETFAEERSIGYNSEPYRGGPVDGLRNVFPPSPWDIPCQPKELFIDHVIKLDVPHSSTVQVGPGETPQDIALFFRVCSVEKLRRCWCVQVCRG